ncbi:MAG: hypothetical protein V9E94_14780 [Microthrixaceae bacterium]
MALAIRSPKDFWTGVIYVGFGAIAFWIARDYSFGTREPDGAGLLPVGAGRAADVLRRAGAAARPAQGR